MFSRCHDCNFHRGGNPLCKLATLKDERGRSVVSIQVDGASGTECLNKSRDGFGRNFDLMIIGEAPGGTEDDLNIPFVGEAGDILMDFLVRAGFDLDKTYITNAVKCRPPRNRTPSREEMKACRVHIEHEIKLVNPKVIMLLGSTAVKLFRIKDKIGTIHGQLFKKQLPEWEDSPEFLIVPSWHPAAFLHRPNPQFKIRALDDYVYAKNLLSGGAEAKKFYRASYKLCDTVDKVKEAITYLKGFKRFAFDTESRSLGIFKQPMIMVQLSRGKDQTFIIPFYRHHPEAEGEWKLRPQWNNSERDQVIEELKSLFEDENIDKIAHNIKYDLSVMKRHCGIEIKGMLWDTLLIHHLLEARSPHGLEIVCDLEFATGDWEQQITPYVGTGKEKKPYDLIPDEDFWQYAATDAEMTYRLLSEKLMDRFFAKENLWNLYMEETYPAIRALAKGEMEGNRLHLDAIAKLEKEYDRDLENTVTRCRELTKPDFNPGSPEQVKDALVAQGFSDKILKPTAPSGYTTAKSVLTDLAGESELIQKILDYRTVNKLKTTYINRALESIDTDGRIRISFNQAGTVSGRLSCGFLHQIPRSNKERVKAGKTVLRDIFGEDEGYSYFLADYSQVELRIFAVLTGERAFLKLLNDPNADFHNLTAAGALGIPPNEVSKFNRDAVGKPMNFGIIYGSEGFALAKVIFEEPQTLTKKAVGLHRAQQMVSYFHSTYPAIKEYLDDVEIIANSRGNMLESVFGRELTFAELAASNKYVRGEARRAAVNFTVQSPAASITTRTINLVDQMLEDAKVSTKEIRFLNTVHDSIAYGVRTDMIDWFAPKFKEIAERPIPQLQNYSFLVKMGWSEKNWNQAEMKAA